MSVMRTETVACPACQQTLEFDSALSINADRRPDLRDAILDGSFQYESCPHCGRGFRLQPEMSYFDIGRKQWLLVRPVKARAEWPALEVQAQSLFADAFGRNTPASLRVQINAIRPRVTFGWAALREKILCAQHGLDDVNLELLKLAMIRGTDATPLTDDTELRLGDVEGDELVFAWIVAVPEEVVEMMRVPRALYDEIAANDTDWKPLREQLSVGVYVDVQRLLLVEAVSET
jgi:CpXC protein